MINLFSLCISDGPYFLPVSMVPSLVYYSHSLLIILCIVTIITFYKRKSEQNILIVTLFSSIVLRLSFSLINWISNIPEVTMLSWSLTILSEVMIYVYSINLISLNSDRELGSHRHKLLVFILALPLIILLPTKLTLLGFNYSNCSSVEGPIATYYVYLIEILFIIYSIYLIIKSTCVNRLNLFTHKSLVSHSTLIFMVILSLGNMYGSLTKNWIFGDIGLIGIPILITALIYSAIKYRYLDVNFDARNILIVIVWTLLAALFTIGNLDLLHMVILITLLIIVSLSVVIFSITSRESKHLSQISSLASSLKDLNDNLESKVTAQTAEIKKSYELERNAHRELIKLSETKDRFISIAQHNLRIPITNIRNKIDRIIENVDRNDGESARLLRDTKESLNNLNEIADDFKSISRINKENNFLNIETVSLLPVIKNILLELAVEIGKLKLDITYPTDTNSWPDIRVDRNKIKDALIVVIENAIKYNRPSGYINISTTLKDRVLNIKIKNTGIGLTTSEKNNIETQSFYRSDRAKLTNPVGMGIGLNLAKSTIESHHGKLEISSDGENLGATVEISIPVDFLEKQ